MGNENWSSKKIFLRCTPLESLVCISKPFLFSLKMLHPFPKEPHHRFFRFSSLQGTWYKCQLSKKTIFLKLDTYLHMVWTKYHMASLTEKCGRAKCIRSHSSRACLVHKNLTLTFSKLSNNMDHTTGDFDDEGLSCTLLSSSPLPERARTSCAEQPSYSTAIPSDF